MDCRTNRSFRGTPDQRGRAVRKNCTDVEFLYNQSLTAQAWLFVWCRSLARRRRECRAALRLLPPPRTAGNSRLPSRIEESSHEHGRSNRHWPAGDGHVGSGAVPAAAQQSRTPAALTLPVTGTFARGGEFSGTVSINRFERRDNEIVAIGLVAGVLNRGSQTLGTAVAGEVVWPVRVSSGGVSVVSAPAPAQRAGQVVRAAWSPGLRSAATLLPVQAGSCPVLNVTLGPNTVDMLGVVVALSGVTLDLSGTAGRHWATSSARPPPCWVT